MLAVILITIIDLSGSIGKAKNDLLADNDPIIINPLPKTQGNKSEPVIIIIIPFQYGLQQAKII